MMQFSFNNGLYKANHIAGRSHNFLAIRLSDLKQDTKVTALPVLPNEELRVGALDVLEQVRAGLSLINQEAGKNYYISEIQYVPSDTYSPDIYQKLAIELLHRIHLGAVFTTP
ncbi:hypothetical protein VA7868_01782 [Vibrio aerogenes CECT 7868]|uniref:Uncharacterized protein n=1 Tax=Vibrio aerogenes CECT 7868 TaxID=1216006 RepID=A0A1M5YJN2_9VIBR|nr:hypothetical protein [Vibrio aerogenes]SHI12124.1 hypothetical protein VA7868_01782 [Vibrio aerogenes CECT 7868]